MDLKIALLIFGILAYCSFMAYSLFCLAVLYFTNTLSSEYKEKEELDIGTVLLVFAQVYMYVFFNPKTYLAEYFRHNEPSKMEKSKENQKEIMEVLELMATKEARYNGPENTNVKEPLTELQARSKMQNFIHDLEDKAKQLLGEAGVCPECMQIMEHHLTEPFSSCKCGTSEDLGVSPFQAIQRLRYHMGKGVDLNTNISATERFEKFVETHNEFLKIKN